MIREVISEGDQKLTGSSSLFKAMIMNSITTVLNGLLPTTALITSFD
jgi:hypothetical protein